MKRALASSVRRRAPSPEHRGRAAAGEDGVRVVSDWRAHRCNSQNGQRETNQPRQGQAHMEGCSRGLGGSLGRGWDHGSSVLPSGHKRD
jgi:hypothetical protein